MKRILAPSILSADFMILGEQLRITEEAGAQYIHFDVMDGMFVPSISFGMPVLSSIRGTTGQTMDVHLMVTDPIRYVEEFAKCGADSITVHQEACEDLQGTLDRIHGCGVKAGISIKPATPVEMLIPYPESLERIRTLRSLLDERGTEADIEVDGGIYHSNVAQVLEAGANVIVSGSGVFKGDVAKNTSEFMEILRRYE